jgi:pimeloyl-ACP methyl ester carboxylesterase
MDGLKSYFIIGVVCILSADLLHAQTVTRSVPVSPLPSHIYLFYLHGGVVQERGANAVSEYYGKYEYHAILDTLANRGFHVISEVRPKDTETEDYARKVRSQIDTLLISGIPPGHIVVVGASLGAYIALETALQLKHPGIKYVLIGLCICTRVLQSL